ncbi:MAG: hypothetical protein M0Z66_11150 [Thermaerobacter sp.]|nr:hypothetical protein [Thermaerobacter sp.]
MVAAHRLTGALACGAALMLLGAASALGLHLVQQSVLQRNFTPYALSHSDVVHAAQHAAHALFPGYRVMALYTATTPLRVTVAKGSSIVTGQDAVLMVLGRDGRAILVAQDTFGPHSLSQGSIAANQSGWEIPFAPPQGSTRAQEPERDLPASLRIRVERWLKGAGAEMSPRSVVAWPFPAGTLVVARYAGGYAAALFPPSGAPQLLQIGY